VPLDAAVASVVLHSLSKSFFGSMSTSFRRFAVGGNALACKLVRSAQLPAIGLEVFKV
jgi:hypothetical protein